MMPRYLQWMGTRLRASVAVLLLGTALTTWAAPYKPSSSAEVLVTIDSAQRQARANLTAFAKRSDARAAVETASKFVALGRAQHDERFFGYASATLAPWNNDSGADSSILFLRADIAQYQHRFGDALRILDTLLARDQSFAPAWLMRSNIRLSQGDVDAARGDCQHLFALREIFTGTVCSAQAGSMMGKLKPSYAVVNNLVAASRATTATRTVADGRLSWAYGVLADMALRLGDARAAETALRTALDISPEDFVSRLEFCDLLIEQNRTAEAEQLIESLTPSDPVLLRRALAAQRSGDAQHAQQTLAAWQAAVDRSADLGVTLHLRELARGQLELLHDPQLALASALKNWEVQREPIDARLLARIAKAANATAELEIVRNWKAALHFEDAGLRL